MSKQSEAKSAQGYRKEAACCKTCKNYSSDMVPLKRWDGDPYEAEKNRRCDLGGFATPATAYCTFFAWKDT